MTTTERKRKISKHPTDSRLLDYLEAEVMAGGPLLLHNGYADCGRNRGLAFRPNFRNLRQAIVAMIPSATSIEAATSARVGQRKRPPKTSPQPK